MVRAAAKNHPSVAIVTSPAKYFDVLEAAAHGGFTLDQRRALAAEAFVHTATYDVHVASWMGNVLTDTSAGTGFPAWIGRDVEPVVGAAVRREPAPAGGALRQRLPALSGSGAGAAAARQGDVLQQLRRRGRRAPGGVRPRRPADRRDHQARQPVRDRGRRRHRRRAPQGARLRPGLGVRRHHRDQPAGDRGDGRDRQGHLHRGGGGAGVRRGRAGDPHREEEPAAARGGRARRRWGRDPADLRRAAAPGPRRDRRVGRGQGRQRRPATTRRAGGWSPAPRPRTRRWRTWSSPGGRSGR